MNLTLLQDELKDTQVKQDALRTKNRGTDVWPQTDRDEDAALDERAKKIVIAIEQEKQLQRDAAFTARQAYDSDPIFRVPHGTTVNDDDEGRKTLSSYGWEIKDGWISRQTSFGQVQRMYPERIIFGPISTSPSTAEYQKTARASFQPQYREGFLRFMQLYGIHHDMGMALGRLSADEQKALSEGVDTAGGYLVPPDMQAELYVRAAQQAVMRRLATIRQTSRDMFVANRVEGHATSGSIYSSAFVGSWVSETPTQSDTDPVFGRLEIPIKKLRLSTRISNDVLADSITNIPAFLTEDGGRNMALTEDQGFIAGVAAGLGPPGLLNDSGVTTVDVEGSTANTISNTSAAAGSAPKLIDLCYAVPSQYAMNGSWVMSRAIEGKVRKLIDGQSRFQWIPTSDSQGQFAATPSGLLGRPVYNSDWVPTDGTDANKVLIFGDLSAYIIAERAQITMRTLTERYADTDQTGFILFERVGGALSNADAVRFGVV